MILALFDFDGTITKKDTFISFLQFTHGKFIFYLYFIVLSPILILYKLKKIENWRAKEIVLKFFYMNYTKEKLLSLGEAFEPIIDNMVYEQAKEKLLWHKSQNHQVLIVSASCDIWISAWCKNNNIQLISTTLEFDNNIFKGKLGSKNCFGQEKVIQIKHHLNLDNFTFIYAYGDSDGDTEMLRLANEPHYKIFNY